MLNWKIAIFSAMLTTLLRAIFNTALHRFKFLVVLRITVLDSRLLRSMFIFNADSEKKNNNKIWYLRALLSVSRRRWNERAIKRESAWGEQKIREKWGRGERQGEGVGRKGRLTPSPYSLFSHSRGFRLLRERLEKERKRLLRRLWNFKTYSRTKCRFFLRPSKGRYS